MHCAINLNNIYDANSNTFCFSNEFSKRLGLSGRPRSLDDIIELGGPSAQPLTGEPIKGDAVSKV